MSGGLTWQRANAVRERVFVCDKARITVESQTGTLLLRVVDAYKHLGGIVNASGSQSREVQARIKAMNARVAALNRPVMDRHEIPVEDRLLLCSTLADTRLFLYAGTWTSLGAAQQRALHRARMHTLRCATNSYRSSDGDNATDREVLVAAGCCTIDVEVAMLRLLFFGRLFRWRTAPLSLFCRLVMGMSALGQRQCVEIWHGSTDLKHVVTSTISLILTMATAVPGWRLLVTSQHSGKHV